MCLFIFVAFIGFQTRPGGEAFLFCHRILRPPLLCLSLPSFPLNHIKASFQRGLIIPLRSFGESRETGRKRKPCHLQSPLFSLFLSIYALVVCMCKCVSNLQLCHMKWEIDVLQFVGLLHTKTKPNKWNCGRKKRIKTCFQTGMNHALLK